MLLNEIVDYLDEFLDIKNIQDSCKNGLEVEGKDEIKKIGFSVDACLESFQKAVSAKCDLLIVHHGMFWGDIEYVTDITYERVKHLIKNDIALYAAHLPLDVHPEVGNNVQLAKLLNLEIQNTFCKYRNIDVGIICKNDTDFDDLVKRIQKHFPVKYMKFNNLSKKVGIITGSGGLGIKEAVDKGCDTFITGEMRYIDYHPIKEYEINIIYGGHYATEVWGLKALMDNIQKKFNINCEFLDLKEIQWKTEK